LAPDCWLRATTHYFIHWVGWAKKRPRPRTYISTTEPLDHMYTPAFRVDSKFESYFLPTMVTDAEGELHEDILTSGLLRTGTLLSAPWRKRFKLLPGNRPSFFVPQHASQCFPAGLLGISLINSSRRIALVSRHLAASIP